MVRMDKELILNSGPSPENVHIDKDLLFKIRQKKLCEMKETLRRSKEKVSVLQQEIFRHEATPGIPGRPKYYIDCAGFAHMINITQAQIDAEAVFFPNHYKSKVD